MKVLDFAPFRGSYVREFELSHINRVNRTIKITHAYNLRVKMLDFGPFSIRRLKKTQIVYYFGGARSKGFATLRNVSKLQFFDKIGHAKSVGFRFYSAT